MRFRSLYKFDIVHILPTCVKAKCVRPHVCRRVWRNEKKQKTGIRSHVLTALFFFILCSSNVNCTRKDRTNSPLFTGFQRFRILTKPRWEKCMCTKNFLFYNFIISHILLSFLCMWYFKNELARPASAQLSSVVLSLGLGEKENMKDTFLCVPPPSFSSPPIILAPVLCRGRWIIAARGISQVN